MVLLGLSKALHDSWLPPGGIEGLWFTAASAALILGVFIQEPHFTRPSDAMVNGVALLLVAAGVETSGTAATHDVIVAGRLLLIAYAIGIVVVAAVAISLKDESGRAATIASSATSVARRVGQARIVFSILLLATGYASFATSIPRLLALYGVWFAIVYVEPLEHLLGWLKDPATSIPMQIAEVVAIEDPGAVRFRIADDAEVEIGDLLESPDGQAIGWIVDATVLLADPEVTVSMTEEKGLHIGDRLRWRRSPKPQEKPAVGRVARTTNLTELRVRTPAMAGRLGIREGRILSASVEGGEVLYQIIGADISERNEGESRRGYVTVLARKLGRWNSEHRRFDPVPWLPGHGSVVTLAKETAGRPFDPLVVGHVPGTDFGLPVDIHRVVTHNTAILGILGIGKTTLTWELIRRMMLEGIKVVVLDITDRYAVEFHDVFPRESQDRIRDSIEAEISKLRGDRRLKGDESGNVEEFREALRTQLASFIESEERLLILNPGGFGVSRRDKDVKSYREDQQFLASMSMVEITRVISEVLLDLMRPRAPEADPDRAQLCLVLEEAHSLVPEWSSTAEKPEQQAANGTVRAILQGRKYGFGCVLVTQRTANVTKSILNQCNTVFAMQVFDATGMEFLSNYIGSTHAQLLSALQPRQAVVFGRAFETNSPVVLDLNDRKDLVQGLWEPRRGEVPTSLPAVDPASDANDVEGPEDFDFPPEWDEVDADQEVPEPPPDLEFDGDDIEF